MKTKPTLPNGFALKNSQILQRIFANKWLEIYKTNDEKFLNLLKNEVELSPAKKAKFGVFDLKIAKKIHKSFFSTQDFSENCENLREKLTTQMGFEAVAGMEGLKKELRKDLINPIKNKEKYAKFKLSIPNGVLLYGPPGCGKTFIVQKLAQELEFTLFEVKHSDVSSPYIHGGVGKIAAVFEKARANAPAIVFIDELDGLMPRRSELGAHQSHKLEEINEFLQHLNNAAKDGILVVAATNQPQLLDEAATRSGRFDKKFFVPPPDLKARMGLFEMYLAGRPLQRLDYEDLAIKTQNYSCADIALICEESARAAVAQDLDAITQDLIESVIATTPPSINTDTRYEFEL